MMESHSYSSLLQGGIYDLKKNSFVSGTFESLAFILSLRDPHEFSTQSLHSFGYHCIPHIGKYGSEYSMSSPMVLLSLPASASCLLKLPQDILGALELDFHQVRPTDSMQNIEWEEEEECGLTTQQVCSSTSTSTSSSSGSSDAQLRSVARNLVQQVLASACKRVMADEGPFHSFASGSAATADSSADDLPQPLVGEAQPLVGEAQPLVEEAVGEAQPLVGEAVGEAQPLVGEAVGEAQLLVGEAVGEAGRQGEDRHELMACVSGSDLELAQLMDCRRMSDISIRSMSPEFINIHSSSETSVEYLTSFTDIPMTLVEGVEMTGMETDNTGATDDASIRLQAKKIVMKAIHLACKRWESMNRRSSIEYLVAGAKRIRLGRSPPPFWGENLVQSATPSSTLNLSTVSEREVPDGSYTRSRKRARANSHETNAMRDFELFQMRFANSRRVSSPSNLLSSQVYKGQASILPGSTQTNRVIPSASSMSSLLSDMETMTISEHGGAEDFAACSMPILPSADLMIDQVGSPVHDSDTLHMHRPVSVDYGQSLANWDCVPDMDFFVIVHSYLPPSVCQKFLCSNTNEVNLVYHCWLFRDMPYDIKISNTCPLEMGVFEPVGVGPVHQDLQDAGVAFHYLEPRTVCIHGGRFSPENAQIQLLNQQSSLSGLHTFFSAARRDNRRVVAYHILPTSPEVEQSIRTLASKCTTLGSLLEEICTAFPATGQYLYQILSSLY